MRHSSSVRACFVPKPTSSLLGSQIVSEPSSFVKKSSRITPWSFTGDPKNAKSLSSKQLMRSYDDSVLNSFTNNEMEEPSENKYNKIPKSETGKQASCPLWLLICLVGFFAIVSLAALGAAIYSIVMVQMALKTTTTSTTSTSTTTALTFSWNTTGSTIAGTTGIPGHVINQLYSPYGLALDASNTLYIAEWQGYRVTKWSMGTSVGAIVAGQSGGTTSSAANAMFYTGDVVLDSSGNLYITDTGNHRVQFWAVGASAGVTLAGTSGIPGSTTSQLFNPYSLARDASTGTLYISDTSNNRIMRYFSGANSGTVIGGGLGAGTSAIQLHTPTGIYLDISTNSVIVANYGAHNVIRWIIGASSWILLAGSPNGTPGSTSTLLSSPLDVAFDRIGNMYVADTLNYRIQFFPNGQSNGTTIVGVTGVPGSDSYHLNAPYGIILDDNFNLYVSDTGNHRVQKFIHY